MFHLRRNKETNTKKAIIYINDCNGCGECIKVCKHNAIDFYELIDGKYAKVVKPELCTGCEKCLQVCENETIEMSWKN